MKRILHFSVGKGNCSLIGDENFVMVVDLNSAGDKSSYDLLSPHFRKRNGKDCIDILFVTHGDGDHCGGFVKFKEKIDDGSLIIGKIIHQGYDRNKSDKEGDKNPPDDYISFQKEIDRREKIKNPNFGDLIYAPKNDDDESIIFEGITYPNDLTLLMISPFDGDDETSDYDVNDLSLVFRLNFDNLGGMLYCGDSSSKYWQDKIIPDYLDNNSDNAKSKYCIISHHGSFSFFGGTREEVRDADPSPDNYEALDYLNSEQLILSAISKFPLNGDSDGGDPPHYAAYKWYHKWFRDNRNVKSDDKHPSAWHYTSDGNVCLKYENSKWTISDDWKEDDDKKSENAQRIGDLHKIGSLNILTGLTAPMTHYHGL